MLSAIKTKINKTRISRASLSLLGRQLSTYNFQWKKTIESSCVLKCHENTKERTTKWGDIVEGHI